MKVAARSNTFTKQPYVVLVNTIADAIPVKERDMNSSYESYLIYVHSIISKRLDCQHYMLIAPPSYISYWKDLNVVSFELKIYDLYVHQISSSYCPSLINLWHSGIIFNLYSIFLIICRVLLVKQNAEFNFW